MCLAIPGKIISLDGIKAVVDFDGIKQNVIVALIQDPEVDKYVIVHAGYAIEMMNEEEASESIELWKEISESQDLNLTDML